MTNPTTHGQVPAIQRYKIGYHSDEWGVRSSTPSGIPDASGSWVRYEDHAAELRRLHAYCQELESHLILDCMTHVQNPAEIEHVAGDVSKNGAELNVSTQQTAPAGFVPVAAFDRLYAHAESLAARLMAAPPQKEVQEPYGWLYDWTHSSATGKPDTTYTGFTKDEAHARKHDNCIAVFTTPQPAPTTQQAGEVVAYLDIGAGGYLDLEAALSDEAMQQLPKGRHALVIAGTYGIDGYAPTPQPTHAQAGAVPLTCEWAHNENDGFWESACGEAWRFDDGGPGENNMHFCHSCGNSLRIKGGQHGAE